MHEMVFRGQKFVVINQTSDTVELLKPDSIPLYDEGGIDNQSSLLKSVDTPDETYIIEEATGETVGYLNIPIVALV